MASKVVLTTPWQRLWRLLAGERAVLTRVFLIAGFGGLISLSLPIGIQAIINFIMAGRASTSLVLLVAFVLIGILVSGLLIIRQQWLIEYFQQRLFARASMEFALRIPRISTEEYQTESPPELMNRFFDVLTLQKGLSKLIIDFSTSLLQVFFGLLLLALYHPLFIIFDLAIVLLIVFLIRISMKKGLETNLRASKWKYKTVAWFEELASNNEVFRMTPRSDINFTKTDVYTGNYVEARQAHFRVLIRHYIALLLFKLLVAAGLLILGSMLVIQREIGIGQFVAAEIIIVLIIASVEKIILNLESVYDVLVALEKIGAITDLDLEENGKLVEFNGEAPLMKAENLDIEGKGYFAPINCANFSVDYGERVYIKYDHPLFVRTLAMLITGRDREYNGHMLYKGRSVKSVQLELMRSEIGEFWSRSELITGSVIENIRFGRKDIASDKVEKTLSSMGLLDEVRKLPDAENTVLLPYSSLVSPAVLKGILLARVIIDHPELLIIDSEQLSTNSERYRAAFNYLMGDKHKWAVVFFGEVSPEPGLYDKVYACLDGRLELVEQKNGNS